MERARVRSFGRFAGTRRGRRTPDTGRSRHVLRAFARRLDDRVRGADSVARLGGDEFAALLGEPTTVRDAEVVADSLRKAFEAPLDIPDVGALRVSASIGAAQFGRGTTPLQAIADADGAMYAEKRVRLGEAAA
jgi:diguanylate cyclase (GGDEF)-like protein